MIALAAFLFLAQTSAPQAPSGWKLPPQEIVDILDAPPTPAVRLSPDAKWMLLVERPSMPALEHVARPWIPLAGLRVDPATNGPKQDQFDTGLVLRNLDGSFEKRVALPPQARIASLSWSHTSARFAFTLVGDDSIDLWVADVPSAQTRRVAARLNTLFGAFHWASDGERLICRLVPADRGPAPERPLAPSGPSIQETAGEVSPVRTYQDLLAGPYDEELLDYYASSRIAVVPAAGGEPRLIGAKAVWLDVQPSPDGAHLLVVRIERPYSYVHPVFQFATTWEVWSADGVLERTVVRQGLAENIPIEGVRTGPRDIEWHDSEDATLVWLEALDGGDPRREAPYRDRVLALAAPFGGSSGSEPRELLRLEHRARSLQWLEDPARILASEYDRDRRWTRSRLFDLRQGGAEPVVLDDRSVNDRYGDPGALLTRPTARGTRVVRQDGEWVYRSGQGDSPEGARPFLDRQSLKSLRSERLWRCSPGSYESFLAMVASSAEAQPVFATSYETPDDPPNVRLRDLNTQGAKALTAFPDPAPQLRGIQKRLVTYARADGVQLSATLYLPRDHPQEPTGDMRLPLVVWAYPQEYSDAGTAGQVSGSPFRFTRVQGPSHLFFLLRGYAVMDNATMPIVGDPETMNETFLEQIVSSARAAIDEAERLGVGDRERAGVGGHSYGAFMTANLLAHCDLFRAGIARSGAYNRTLTPFGFQSERRTLWEAPASYTKLSPFFHADKIDEPILLVHGEKDSNSGTFPMQSERLFQGIKGHGGRARLVKLPAEDHGYRSRECVLHCTAEMLEWFDAHVKNAPPRAGRAVEAAAPEGGR